VPRLAFAHARTVVEGPNGVPGKPFRQLRRFEVYDLLTTDSAALRLGQQLIEAGSDPLFADVICASRADIAHGRHNAALISPQAAFLVGPHRMMPDLPPML
jgi:hypothetical protein